MQGKEIDQNVNVTSTNSKGNGIENIEFDDSIIKQLQALQQAASNGRFENLGEPSTSNRSTETHKEVNATKITEHHVTLRDPKDSEENRDQVKSNENSSQTLDTREDLDCKTFNKDTRNKSQNIHVVLNDIVRPETVGQPAPSYIPDTEYDKDGNKIEYIIIDSDDEMDPIEISSDEEEDYIPLGASLPAKRKHPETSSNRVQCSQCHVKYNTYNPLTHVVKSKYDGPLCRGCASLFSVARTSQEKYDMIKWFATGRLPSYDLPPELPFEEWYHKLRLRCHAIRKRSSSLGYTSNANAEDLAAKYEESNFRCKLSNLPVFLHDTYRNRMPYWALSIDHIIPLSKAKKIKKTHNMENLQITCSCLNLVKGSYSDEQLKEWYEAFLTSVRQGL